MSLYLWRLSTRTYRLIGIRSKSFEDMRLTIRLVAFGCLKYILHEKRICVMKRIAPRGDWSNLTVMEYMGIVTTLFKPRPGLCCCDV